VRRYDDYSQFRINVSMSAEIDEKKTLEIDMEGSVTTKIEEEGFFSSVFAEFYLQGLYERTTALSKKGLEEARKDMESSIAALAKKS
ncbi:MAG: hypothetical protein HY368_02790, partial [Candidatus Aenigmarchaeota archaeon]|nr:hypothetical protein [Candidatus Aenigmarchaeota archaeon]